PRQSRRIFFRKDLYPLSVYRYGAVVAGNSMSGVASLNTVIFEKMSQHTRLGQVVDCGYLKSIVGKKLSESKSAYSSESVDRDLSHWLTSVCKIFLSCSISPS